MSNIIRPTIILVVLLSSCTQNVVNIRGSEAKSLDALVHIRECKDGPEVKAKVHFGPGTEDLKFGPSPGDG